MHNIEHHTYPEKVNKKQVQKEMDHIAAMEDWQEGCTGLNKDIRWLEGTIYPNLQAAEDAIHKLDRGWYDQLAVKYYEPVSFTDAKRQQLEGKRNEALDEYHRRDTKVYPKTLSSAFIGCKKCGSRLAVQYLPSNFCPVCKNDLRPDYMLKSIQAAEQKLKTANIRLSEYIDKHSKKQVYWLVKIEYHT